MSTTAQTPKTKVTDYVVMKSDSEDGPWEVVGTFSAPGQIGAKKAAAAQVDEQAEDDAEAPFFIAVAKTSYLPQKPSIKTQYSF